MPLSDGTITERERTQSSQRPLCELCAHICVSKKHFQNSLPLPERLVASFVE